MADNVAALFSFYKLAIYLKIFLGIWASPCGDEPPGMVTVSQCLRGVQLTNVCGMRGNEVFLEVCCVINRETTSLIADNEIIWSSS